MSLEDKNYLEDENGERYTLEDIKDLVATQDHLATALREEYNSRKEGAALEALKLALMYDHLYDEEKLGILDQARKFRDFLLEGSKASDAN